MTQVQIDTVQNLALLFIALLMLWDDGGNEEKFMSQQDNSLLSLLKKQGARAIDAPGDTKTNMLRRSIRANIAQTPADPGPRVADVERFQAQCAQPDVPYPVWSGTGAIAYDATLDPVDVAQLRRIQVLVDERATAMAQRDSLLERVKELERQRVVLERHISRAVNYWAGKWTSARRTIKLLILVCGSVIAIETLALAGLIWKLL